jgi:hypothetical protein
MIGTAWRWSASKPSIKVMPVSAITASDLARIDRLNFRIGSLRRRARRGGKHGQAMIEFTLVLPFFFFVLFGVFEFGLLMFSLGTSRWSAVEGARVVSEQGTLTQTCSSVPGCAGLANGPGAPNACNADCQAISYINVGPLGSTSIATIDEIDITRLKVTTSGSPPTSSLTPATSLADGTSCSGTCVNKYKLDFSAIGTPRYDPSKRDVQLGQTDYAQVLVKFHYQWKSGIFNQFPVPNLSAGVDIRLEPQGF